MRSGHKKHEPRHLFFRSADRPTTQKENEEVSSVRVSFMSIVSVLEPVDLVIPKNKSILTYTAHT
jgi:hypothetical protein